MKRVFFLCLLSVAAASGSVMAQQAAGPDGKPAQKKNANPCRDEVATALSKLRKTSWFRMTSSMISENGPTAMVVDYVLPDKMHQKVTHKLSGATSEVVLVGLKAWANQGKGWQELPYDVTSNLRTQMFESVVQEQTDVGEYACKGKAEVEGREAYSYRLDEEAQAGGTPQNQAYRMFYVDGVTGLPVRTSILVPGRENAPIFRADYSYPLDIKIEPPKDVVGVIPPAGGAAGEANVEKK